MNFAAGILCDPEQAKETLNKHTSLHSDVTS